MKVKPGYKQTEVGVIPEDWEVSPLSSFAQLKNGYAFKSSTYTAFGNLKVVTIANVQDGFLDIAECNRIRDLPRDLQAHHRLQLGDILISMTGNVGRVCRVTSTNCLLNQRVGKLVPSRVDGAFLFLLLGQRRFLTAMSGKAKGGAQGNLSVSDITDFQFPLPPTKTEQEAITEALSDADFLIESLEQFLVKKRQLKQGAIQELLTGKKRMAGFESKPGYKQTEVGVIPEDWAVLCVRDLVKQGPQNGYSGRVSDSARGTPTLSLAATSSGRLILNDATIKHMLQSIPVNSHLFLEPFDVLVQRSNTVDLVGTTAVFDGPSATYVYPDLMMRLRFRTSVTGLWFWRYANSSRGRSFFRSIAAGSTGSMPKISGEKLREMPLPVPPLPEQTAIVAILSDMDAEIAALETKLAKARQIKQGMMQELLTGRIRLV